MIALLQTTEMTLGEKIFVVLDKGVLAAALALVVFFFNRKLQEQRQAHETFRQNQKSRDEVLTAIAESRVNAYKKLWELSQDWLV